MGVHEDVLALVVEQPGYGYGIVKGLDGRYSSAAVYKALVKLQELGLVEPVEMLQEAARPQKWFRATIRGVGTHGETVTTLLRRRLENARPESIADVIDAIDLHERDTLEELRRNPPEEDDIIGCLIADERRSSSRARLDWATRSRERVNDLSSS